MKNSLPTRGGGLGRGGKAAFTLAEVLITLGIIGVVAAMTLPTLVQNHRKKEVVTKLQKVYSIMNQAINVSVAEYGDVKSWAGDCGTSGTPTCTVDEAMEWFDKYIGKNLQIIKKEKAEDGTKFYVYLKDGTILHVQRYLYDIGFYLNKKALEYPQAGRNLFTFRFNPVLATGQKEEDNVYTTKPTFEPYATSWDGTREMLIDDGTYGCKAKGGYCTKLIQYDGWEIKDDYPVKL